MKMRTLAAVLAASTVVAGSALAFVAPEYMHERSFEVATGSPARLFRPVADQAPNDQAQQRYDALARDFGTAGAVWDGDTNVPLRLWGAGVELPGSIADAQVAERGARALLEAHLDLLAPGSSPSDWTLYANVVRGDTRTVVYTQSYRGMSVVGGRIEMEIKRDRLFVIGSEALPNVAVAVPNALVNSNDAGRHAAQWVGDTFATVATPGATSAPVVLPIVRARGGVEYHIASVVPVETAAPVGRWNVYVDAASGAPLARHETLAFATGTLLYHVPTTYPQAGYSNRAALFATHNVNGSPATADVNGVFTLAGALPATVAPGIAGTYVSIKSQSGTAAAGSFSMASGASQTWDLSSDEKQDAQLDAYINANDAKQYARAHIDANVPWLAAQIPVFVNENMTCNAYSTGDDIHFFIGGANPNYNPNDPASIKTCANTGRINDVLYHEFAHSLNANTFIGDWSTLDGGYGEGQADAYAQTIIDNSGIGRGFDADHLTTPLRESDPSGMEFVYPKDFAGAEIHDAGRIFSGTMWDLRKALIAKLGKTAGVAQHDKIYYGISQHAVDMPSTYAEALAADDDNGNLADGTPNQCTIQSTFAAHGLASGGGVTGVGVPTRDGFTITVPLEAGNTACPPPGVQSATVTWQLRDDPTTMGTVDLTAGATSWSGAIPTQAGGKVVQYKVDIALASGSTVTYPDNAADPLYEFYVGNVTPIKCWDFETQPTDWVHSAKSGTDEWQWGAPASPKSSGDPTAAHGGTNIYGIDLGQNSGDGIYADQTDQVATTPVVDTTGFAVVRLQYYRWLGVEDGMFDRATINVDGNQRWANFNSMAGNNANTQHIDKEWRFQDVDLTADAADHKVQVSFELSSDQALTFGGWTVDDVCIVGVAANAPNTCGNGIVEGGEQCDDGNVTDGDGCSATCQTEGGPMGGPGDQGCCSTSRSNAAGPALLLFGVLAWRRRRRSDQM